MPWNGSMNDNDKPSSWLYWRPVRRHYIWRYRTEEPPRISLLLGEKTIELNDTSSLVWERIDGAHPILSILGDLADIQSTIPKRQLRRDLFGFLLFLHQEKLIYIHWDALG